MLADFSNTNSSEGNLSKDFENLQTNIHNNNQYKYISKKD